MDRQNLIKFLVILFTGIALLFLVTKILAVDNADQCGAVFTYPTKTSDFNDSRININYQNSDQEIDVTAHTGYQITEVALEVSDDGFAGFHVYATGSLLDFNPPGSQDINGAKVKVQRVCPEPTMTPTSEPTATPTLEPTVTPTPTEEVTPTPTEEVTPTPSEEVTPTPTDEITPEPTREATPTPTVVVEKTPQESQVSVFTHPAGCDALVPERVTDIWVERGVPNDGKLDVHWGDSQRWDKVHIRYSEIDGEWRYGLLNTNDDGMEEIGGLVNRTHYYFQVAFVNGCAVGEYSHSFDPIP